MHCKRWKSTVRQTLYLLLHSYKTNYRTWLSKRPFSNTGNPKNRDLFSKNQDPYTLFYKNYFWPRYGSVFHKILMICRSKMHKKRKLFLRFQEISQHVTYGIEPSRSMFLIIVYLIKKTWTAKTRKTGTPYVKCGPDTLCKMWTPYVKSGPLWKIGTPV